MRGLITLIFWAASFIVIAYLLGYDAYIKSIMYSIFNSVEKAVYSLEGVIKSAKDTGIKAMNGAISGGGGSNIDADNLTKTITNVLGGASK